MSIAEKLTTIAENQQRVFDAGRNIGGGGGDYDSGYNEGYSNGYDSGFNEGHDIGYSEGENAEHDRFWDNYQDNGNRVNYQFAFAGGWGADNFMPKYDIIPTSLNTTFHSFAGTGFDIAARLEELGVTLDTSKCTNFASTFMWANIERLGVIDLTSASNGELSSTFAYGNITTIDKLIVKPENAFSYAFTSNKALTNITFEGNIGNNISFQWQDKLTRASIESVINHLSTTASGKTATFSRTSVTNAFGSTTASAWTTLVNSKSNWTISLV